MQISLPQVDHYQLLLLQALLYFGEHAIRGDPEESPDPVPLCAGTGIPHFKSNDS